MKPKRSASDIFHARTILVSRSGVQANVRCGSTLRHDEFQAMPAAMNGTDLIGKRVHVIFREFMHHGGIKVVSVVGTCAEINVRFMSINNVTKAFGPNDVDVTEKLGIRGKSTMIATRKIEFIFPGEE